MAIRHAKLSDLQEILNIFAHARKVMIQSGNPTQWGLTRPDENQVRNDIEQKICYVITDNNEICGVFTSFTGNDPTYKVIEDGAWLNDKPYTVIHRIAGNGKKKGILKEAVSFCEKNSSNIRIDTHKDNKIMQHLLIKYGFIECGRIYATDNTPRIAYQKICGLPKE